MYKRVSYENMIILRDIFLDSWLVEVLKFEFPKLNIVIEIDNISETKNLQDNQFASCFLLNDSMEIVQCGENKYMLLLEFMETINSKGELSMNIALSCSCDEFYGKFGNAFYQIGLENSLEDQENIYIVRNVTSMFNNKLYKEIDAYGCETITFNSEHFIIFNQFAKKDFDDIDLQDKFLTKFLGNFIRCAFIKEGFLVE